MSDPTTIDVMFKGHKFKMPADPLSVPLSFLDHATNDRPNEATKVLLGEAQYAALVEGGAVIGDLELLQREWQQQVAFHAGLTEGEAPASSD